MMPKLVGEHKTGIFPGRSECKLILQFPTMGSAQGCEHKIREGNGAALIILGGIQCVFTSAATDLLKLLIDDELTLQQINAVLLKA